MKVHGDIATELLGKFAQSLQVRKRKAMSEWVELSWLQVRVSGKIGGVVSSVGAQKLTHTHTQAPAHTVANWIGWNCKNIYLTTLGKCAVFAAILVFPSSVCVCKINIFVSHGRSFPLPSHSAGCHSAVLCPRPKGWPSVFWMKLLRGLIWKLKSFCSLFVYSFVFVAASLFFFLSPQRDVRTDIQTRVCHEYAWVRGRLRLRLNLLLRVRLCSAPFMNEYFLHIWEHEYFSRNLFDNIP